MVFTAAELNHFFESPLQIAIPHDTCLTIGREGISTVKDLSEMTDEELKLMVDNLRKLSGPISSWGYYSHSSIRI